jgi:hypothetical protein
MILIVSNENQIIGADKDFLKDYSINELNKNFSNDLNDLDKLKNDLDKNDYKIEEIDVKSYKLLIFEKNENPDDNIDLNIPSSNSENTQDNQNNLNINLDDLLLNKESKLPDNNIDLNIPSSNSENQRFGRLENVSQSAPCKSIAKYTAKRYFKSEKTGLYTSRLEMDASYNKKLSTTNL